VNPETRSGKRGRFWAVVPLVVLAVALLLRSQTPGAEAQRGRGGRGGAVALPDGPGKTSVEGYCAGCHSLNLIVNSGGFTRQGWEELFGTMVALPAEQRSVVADYLAAHFPEQPRPEAVVVPGPETVSFKEWDIPTLGSRPHDPLAAADGSIWYTGQFSDTLGRVDVTTGEVKEYPLPPGSGPHGLTEHDGYIYYTANAKGYIGRLDPKTGEVKQYALPEAVRDPHTPLFDDHGILWFTAQGANMVGRLDPVTGDVKMATSPTPRSNPYGMVIDSKGVPYFVEFGANKIARFDPTTLAITEYTLPHPDTRPRRVAITSNDVLWYADYPRGYLGRFDPATGQAQEWPSPGGPRSRPYGITALDGTIWYSESGVRPNTIVRFDPRTQKFQSWIIPGGGGVVRNMMTTRDGNIAIAESGRNKIGLVVVGGDR
jgi:virginiamycin B lyase